MKKYTAVFYEAFQEEEILLRRFLPSANKYLFTRKTIQESGDEFPCAGIISTRTQSKIPLKWFSSIDAVFTRSTGYDHLDDYLKKTDLDFDAGYLPDYAGRAVAEQAMMLWTCLLRRLNFQKELFDSFKRDGLTGNEIKGKNILLVGVGRIGSEIVDIASSLSMNVFGHDLIEKSELKKKYGLKYLSLEKGIKKADIIVCALPLTTLTKSMLNYDLLKSARKNSVFINIARGEISPSADLLKLLEENIFSGLALDVFEYEKELALHFRDDVKISSFPPAVQKSIKAVIKMMNDQRVIFTPHNAFNTSESTERKSFQTAENIKNYIRQGRFITPVIL